MPIPTLIDYDEPPLDRRLALEAALYETLRTMDVGEIQEFDAPHLEIAAFNPCTGDAIGPSCVIRRDRATLWSVLLRYGFELIPIGSGSLDVATGHANELLAGAADLWLIHSRLTGGVH